MQGVRVGRWSYKTSRAVMSGLSSAATDLHRVGTVRPSNFFWLCSTCMHGYLSVCTNVSVHVSTRVHGEGLDFMLLNMELYI